MFIFFIVTVIIKTILSYISIVLSGNFIDMLVSGGTEYLLIKYCLIVGSVGIASLVLGIMNGYMGTKIQTEQSYSLSRDIFDHMEKLPMSFIEKQDTAYLSQRINTDTNALLSFFIDNYIALYVSIASMIVSFVMIIRIDFRLAIILGVLSIAYYIMYVIFKKKIFKGMNHYREKSAAFFGRYYESMESIGFIKNHSVKDIYMERLDQSFSGLFKSLLSYQKVQFSMSACDGVLSTAANLVIYLLGGLAILQGNVTIGLFTIVLSLFGNLVSSVKFFLSYGKSYQEAMVSLRRIEELMKIPQATNGYEKLYTAETISLNNVSFGYDKPILNDFSYTFKKGNIYCIVGKNGVGKSTLLNLILGSYVDEMRGDIYIDGIDIRKLDMMWLKRKVMGYSEQDTCLICGTIKENLTLFYNNENYLEKYLEAFSFCNGKVDEGLLLDSQINVLQNNLSGGEKQKISIIRQLVLDPCIMIFDEPTANLESEGKKIFADILQRIKSNKIIIIVTHDPSLIGDEDVIIKMEKV